MEYIARYLDETATILTQVDWASIKAVLGQLVRVKHRGGRLFFLGNGGSAANCSHAVNDFRKIAGMEAYTPTDNVAELTARTNDTGWETTFVDWLKGSHLTKRDAVFVFSVNGGTDHVSVNLVKALDYAKECSATIVGIVGETGGVTAILAAACIRIPTLATPQIEAFQAVLWHLLVMHPTLQATSVRATA